MKPILLIADNMPDVYMVPDAVADDLHRYCLKFCKWLKTSKHAAMFWKLVDFGQGEQIYLCYGCDDFIDYLNTWIFPEQPSYYVEHLPKLEGKDPRYEEYVNAPQFNF